MTIYQVIFYDSDGYASYSSLGAVNGSSEGAQVVAFEGALFGDHPERVRPLICIPVYTH